MSHAGSSIQLNRVTKHFGERRVLDELDATFKAGAVVALVGASGSGKTTLLRCLNGLCRVDSGEIEVAGHRLTPSLNEAQQDRLRADVGLVFQDYQLFPHLSVLENLSLAPQLVRKLARADAERRAQSLLERVGLADRGHCRPSELSGGQKQRVALARALAQDPRVLLLDEPTSALDASTRDDIAGILREQVRSRSASEPLTVVLVSHDLQFAERLADELWSVALGKLVRGHQEPRGPV